MSSRSSRIANPYPRRKARKQALQLLFQAEARGMEMPALLAGDFTLEEGPLEAYGRDLALGAWEFEDRTDALISRYADAWSLDRITAVDRNLLRLALYEILLVGDVQVAVAIDEAVELAQLYSTDDSHKFINGVLGRVVRELAEEGSVEALLESKENGRAESES